MFTNDLQWDGIYSRMVKTYRKYLVSPRVLAEKELGERIMMLRRP